MVGGPLTAAASGVEKSTAMNNFSEKVSFIWGVADLLRGDYKPTEYRHALITAAVTGQLDIEKAS